MDGEFNDDLTTLDVVDFREALAPGVGLLTQEGFDTRLALSQTTNLIGNTPPKLVDLTARLELTNTLDLAGGAALTSRFEYLYRGEYQYRVFNNPLVDTVPSYYVVNLLINYKFANGQLNLGFGATNLFDKDGVNARFSNPFGLLTTSEEFIPPKEVFVTFRYDF
jgi:iron complex outermembrane receptor protein